MIFMNSYESDRQKQIQKMMHHIGDLIHFLLQNLTYIYKQNKINYPVDIFHEQLMRMVAPPFKLLGMVQDENQKESDKQQPNQSNNKEEINDQQGIKVQGGNDQLEKKNESNEKPMMEQIAKINNIHLLRKQQQSQSARPEFSTQLRKKYFIGNNPRGVYRQIKQIEQEKGDLFKKSLKVLRHTKKFTENYDEYEARKNDPNRMRKRRPRQPKKERQQYQQIMNRAQSKGKRGRKVEDWGLQQKIYEWVKEVAAKGRRIRKVDIRNQFKSMSGGKFSGSTGWCRRFIERHPQINNWFKKSTAQVQKNQIDVFDRIKTVPYGIQINPEITWIEPKNIPLFESDDSSFGLSSSQNAENREDSQWAKNENIGQYRKESMQND